MIMKKWMMCLALLYVLTGCKKEQMPKTDQKPNYRVLLLAKEIPAQKVMFNMLKDEDKFEVWQDHFHLRQQEFSTGSREWKLIEELIRFNKSSYYKYGSDSKEIATTYFSQSWLKRAEKVFTSEKLYEIAFNLNSTPKIKAFYSSLMKPGSSLLNQLNTGSPYNNEAYSDCFCAVGSNYTCPYTTYVYNNRGSFMETHYASCFYYGGKPCDVEGGCGFVGWSLCDGNVCS
jgi:hypothetical protein